MELKDIKQFMVYSLIVIIITVLISTWIILEGAQSRHRIELKSIEGLKSEIVELQAALEKHDSKPEWWEKK